MRDKMAGLADNIARKIRDIRKSSLPLSMFHDVACDAIYKGRDEVSKYLTDAEIDANGYFEKPTQPIAGA